MWMLLRSVLDQGMLSSVTYRTLLVACALLLQGMAAEAARGVLHLDGILMVRGERAATARVIILPTGGAPSVQQLVSGPFQLSLPLDGTYLLSFEREGLVTKQVYFDTTVPVDRHADTMNFPFKVGLFPDDRDNTIVYAGPVGVVRYSVPTKDFTYSTDYSLKEGAPMQKRLKELQLRMEQRGPDGLPLDRTATTYTAAVGVATESLRTVTTAEVPIVQREAIDPPGPELAQTPHMPTAETDGTWAMAERSKATAPAAESAVQRSGPSAALRTVTPVKRRTPPPPAAELEPGEELIVEHQRVITVLRIAGPQGRVSEYRRVVDRQGAILHFRDGLVIPEHLYREQTGR